MDRFEKYLDKLVNKVIAETVDSKADKIVSEIEKKSGLKGKQHKIDVAEPKGKITSADFKKLRATKKDMKEYSMGDDQIEKVEPYGDFSTDSPKKVGKVKNVGFEYEKKIGKEFNEENDMFGSFDDEHGWFDKIDRKHSGEFDFDYDEEEFEDFQSLMSKYGRNQSWFGPNDGELFFNKYKEKFGGKPFRVRTAKKIEEQGETEEGNAFSGALAKAKKDGKKSFDVDGKTYEVTEMEGFHGDFEDEDTKLAKFVKDALKRNSMLFSKADKELSKKDKHMKNDLEDIEDEEYGRHMWIGEEKNGKFIQKATKKMEKKGTSGKFGDWCKSHGLDKDGEVTKKCIDKAMKSDDSKVVKMANFAKNIGGFKGAKHESVQMTENEIVELIERLVNEEKNNIEKKRPSTEMEMNKISNANKNTNQEALKATTEKMKKWSKDSNVEGYTTEPKHFPKGNGEMKEMDKKAYKASDAVEEYIDAFAYPGMTNLVYDEIKPNDEWIEANIKGSSKTGNATKDKDGNDLGNAVSSELGEKMFKNYKDNVYGAEQMNASYKRYPQPVDQAGESTEDGDLKLKKGAAKSEKIFKQLESTSEKENVLNEQISRMKNIVGYKQKTQ
jgi:hypothetical protein